AVGGSSRSVLYSLSLHDALPIYDLFVVALARLRLGLAGRLVLRLGRGLHERLQLLGQVAGVPLDVVLARVALEEALGLGDGVLDRLLLLVRGALGVLERLLGLQPEAVELVLGLRSEER